jgi:hypothetical protein
MPNQENPNVTAVYKKSSADVMTYLSNGLISSEEAVAVMLAKIFDVVQGLAKKF